jgi:hypothetical protein
LQSPLGRPQPATPPAPPASPPPERNAADEAFAVAAVDASVDLVGDRKSLALANGASLLPMRIKAQVFHARGGAPVFEWQTAWRLPGTARPATPPRDRSATLPASDELAWRWLDDQQAWQSIILRKPPLITTRDVASAELGTQKSTTVTISANTARPVTKEATLPSIEITLTQDGARKLAAWARANYRRPIAYVARGIVVDEWFVEEDDEGAPSTHSFTLRTLGPGTTEADLRAFAAHLADRPR